MLKQTVLSLAGDSGGFSEKNLKHLMRKSLKEGVFWQ
jgi:hypothetical protein